MSEETKFPQYRKYAGIDTWYKIISEDLFVELKKVGKHIVMDEIEALQYPEKLRIQDMLECRDKAWEKVSEEEFVRFRTEE